MLRESLIFLSHKLNSLRPQLIQLNPKVRLALIVVHTYVFIAPIDFVVNFTSKYGASTSTIAIAFLDLALVQRLIFP